MSTLFPLRPNWNAVTYLLLVYTGSALWGQTGPAEIEGAVLDVATGTPIRKAYVTLSTVEDDPAEALAITDDSGRFAFANIPAGRYKLHARSDGYQPASFGAPTSHHAAGVITLHPGERRQDFNLRLTMLGAISGVVLDQDGDPVSGAMVSLWIPWFPRRKPGFADHGWVQTNGQGEYRFSDLVPGRYLVMVNGQGRDAQRIQPESFASSQPIRPPAQFQFGIQYFPSAARPSDASLLIVAAGKDLDGIDFHLGARPTTTLHGTVVPPADFPADAFIQIALVSMDMPDQQHAPRYGVGSAPPAYEFNIGAILPGDYLLVASISSGGRQYRGVQRVSINADAENHATIKLDAGIDLAGTVKIEGQKPEAGTRVVLSSGDDIPYNGTPQAQVKPDGTFVISGVVPGIWDINVNPLPDGGYIKSMRLGRQDVLTEDMIIAGDTKDRLDIVVSTHGGILEGDVKTESGEAAGLVHVLAAPDGDYSNVLSFYSATNSDEKGHFKIKHLTPGRFKIYAFDVLDYCAWCNPDFLKPYASQGQPIQISEGANQLKEIRLIHNSGKQP